MGLADGITRQVDAVLRKFMPLVRPVYKRVYTRTGGNDLIGRPGSVTYVDTLLDPQPIYDALGRSRSDLSGTFQLTTTTQGNLQDYKFLISQSAMTLAEIESTNIVLVLKDGANEEVYNIIDYEPISLQSTVIANTVIGRSVKRP